MNEKNYQTANKLLLWALYIIGLGTVVLFSIKSYFLSAAIVCCSLAVFTLLYFFVRKKVSYELKGKIIFIFMYISVFFSYLVVKGLNDSLLALCGIVASTLLFFNPKITRFIIALISGSYVLAIILYKFTFPEDLQLVNIIKDFVIAFIIFCFIYYVAKFGEILLNQSKENLQKSNALVDEIQEKVTLSENLINEQNSVSAKIKEASAQLEKNANGIFTIVDTLSAGASTQSSTIEELSASIHAVKEKAEQNTKIAEELKNISHQTTDNVNQTTSEMQSMIKAMEDIKSVSSQINNIVSNIDSIAFQTNILALNASVEAARAGAAGKGFAVVATEVRTLAQKSAEAAQETASLIDQTIKAIQVGTDTVNNTASSLDKIILGATSSETYVKQILDASIAQNVAINEISDGVNQISNVVQENVSTSEESAAASQQLLNQAKELVNIVK